MGLVLGWGLPGIWAGTLLDNGFRWLFLTLPLPALIWAWKDRKCKNSFYLGFRRDLLDSYEAILSGIEETFAQFSIPYDKEKVREFILKLSVQDLLESGRRERKLDVEVLNQVRAQSLAEKNAQVVLMPGARDVLAWAEESGIQQFVYTHKGDNALTILRDLGLESYFTEILTSQSGFARKPSSEAATYLLDKYQLDPEKTYYIGIGLWMWNLPRIVGFKVSTF